MRKSVVIIGVGLALFPIHNHFLTELATVNGQVLLFIPALGFILAMVGTGLFILSQWEKVKSVGLGDRRVFIPLMIIAAAIAISGLGTETIGDKLALLGISGSLVGLYVAGRVLGKDIFLPLAVGAVVASVGVILYGVIFRVFPSGGFVFEQNYDIVVGYVLLGATLFVHRWQPILAGLALVAMFLSGSPEALLPIGIVGVAMLIRKDWSAKLLKVLVPLIVVAVIWFGIGWGAELYGYAAGIVKGNATVPDETGEMVYDSFSYRIKVIKDNLTNIKPFGTGYVITEFSRVKNVHNVPLILVQQLGYPGIIAALAWLWVTIYCLVKTKWKYVWLLIIGLSIFDHFIWTQLGLWWWVIVGVTTAGFIKSDYMFREAA